MEKRCKNWRYAYLAPGTDDVVMRALNHQQMSGYSVGIVYIEDVWYPVALSSLVQVPWIRSLLRTNQKIGVLTANQAGMIPGLMKSCGIDDPGVLVIRDMRHASEFSAIPDNRGEFDNVKVRQEVVAVALDLLKEDPDLGAILLACSDMPAYAAAVQAATQLPVFDFITLIRWLHHATTQRPYSGWM